MKIGEFSKKHQVSIDTVRHYINEGLLTPLRVNTQYNFSEIDDRVMESILLLKSMNFKLEEMKPYLLFQTLYTNNAFSYLGSFKKEFQKKLDDNKREIQRLTKMNELIEKQLMGYHKIDFQRGISLRSLSELICPDCEEELELSASEILHNEIMEGELVCPKCGRTYYIRHGILADELIEDLEDVNNLDISEMMNQYMEQNDETYILKIREIFQQMAEITDENVTGAKNILIDGEGCEFLNSPVLRTIPKDARLFVHISNNLTMKALQEDFFPKDTVFYMGDVKNAPFRVSMDFMFVQDYDLKMINNHEPSFYPHVRPSGKIICFKTLITEESNPFPDEQTFLEDMRNLGYQKESVYKTGKILMKKDSADMSIIDKIRDMEIEYGIYTFKTLG